MDLHEFADKDCVVGLRSFTVIGYSGKVRINSTQHFLLSLSKSKPMDHPSWRRNSSTLKIGLLYDRALRDLPD